MPQICGICRLNLNTRKCRTLRCNHTFHQECLRKLYRHTKHVIFEGELLEPKCLQCRKPFKSKDIGGSVTTVKERLEFQDARQLQWALNEPSYASIPPAERPLRLNRVILEVERQERQKALDELIKRREKFMNRAPTASTESEPVAGPSGMQTRASKITTPRSSDSSGSIITTKSKFRPVLESEASEQSGSTSRLFIDSRAGTPASTYERSPKITVHHRPGASSSQPAPKLPTQDAREPGSAPASQMPAPLGSFERPIEISSTESSQASQARRSQEPRIKVEPKVEPGTEPRAEPVQPPVFNVRLQPQLKKEIKTEQDEFQDLQVQVYVISEQFRQAEENARSRPNVPTEEDIHVPDISDDDSDVEDDDNIGSAQPQVILGTINRGRHTRYRVRWSDGAISLHPTAEVELRIPDLLENYRRELRRLATARTRYNQATGKTPKIPGRGRGRGRKQ